MGVEVAEVDVAQGIGSGRCGAGGLGGPLRLRDAPWLRRRDFGRVAVAAGECEAEQGENGERCGGPRPARDEFSATTVVTWHDTSNAVHGAAARGLGLPYTRIQGWTNQLPAV